MINSNSVSKPLDTMGGKEDIAYNNCKIMLSEDWRNQVLNIFTVNIRGGHTWPVWRNNCTICQV